MSFTNSPNMGLPIPAVGNEPGPDYATDVNNSLNIVDQHNHAAGSGVQINPNGIDINTSLPFNGNFATSLAGLTFIAQSSPPSTNFTAYMAGVDFFIKDGLGNNIQITSNGGVAGTPGSIAGLTPPASVTYVSGNQTFVFQSNTSIAANLDGGALLLRNLSPNSTNAVTLQPPAALGSNYSLTLPTIPASQKIMTLDNSGIMSAPYVVDNSTIVISSNTIQVPAGGITGTQIAANTVAVSNLVLNPRVAYYCSASAISSPTQDANFDAVIYDVGVGSPSVTASAPGTGNWRFTNNTGASGYFRVSGTIVLTTNTTDQIGLYLNGVVFSSTIGATGAGSAGIGHYGATIFLAAGDYISIRLASGETLQGNAALASAAPTIFIEQI